jgi:hypothetical protein
MDSQLRDPLANWPNVSGISDRKTSDPRLDTRPCLNVAEAIKPFSKDISLANLNHLEVVSDWLHRFKHFPGSGTHRPFVLIREIGVSPQ